MKQINNLEKELKSRQDNHKGVTLYATIATNYLDKTIIE
jgi:hypothetical protein